jgi:cell wall-associated NlpC family hydrolase
MNERHHRGVRRTLGVLVTAAVATAALGAPAFAATPSSAGSASATTARAAAAPKVASRTTISVDRSFQRSAPPVATVRTTVKGKAARATVSVYVSGKRVAAVSANGTARVRLPKSLTVGRHTLRAVSVPATRSASSSSAAATLTVHTYGSRVVEDAVRYAGVPYRLGGTTRAGMDCSGFTQRVYRDAGVARLPRTAAAQARVGHLVSRASARPGDLVHTQGHVGIYVGNGRMIDAPRPGKKIQVRLMYAAAWTFIRVSNAAITI